MNRNRQHSELDVSEQILAICKGYGVSCSFLKCSCFICSTQDMFLGLEEEEEGGKKREKEHDLMAQIRGAAMPATKRRTLIMEK